MVTPFSIHPVIHGGAVRISNLLRRMAATSDVSLLVLGGGTDDPAHRRAYEGVCERVFFHRLPEGDSPSDPWRLLPPSPLPFSSPSISDRISALVDAHSFDIVQLEFAELGAHVQRIDNAATILTEHDLGFRTQQRQRALEIGRRFDAADRVGDNAADGLRQERFEILACENADQVHCMSRSDRSELASRLAKTSHLEVIPNGVDTEIFQPGDPSQRRDVLFLGSFPHLPNLDAFEFLLDAVWPEIRRVAPDAALTVAGARPPEAVLARDGRDGVRVVGEVDEVAPLYRNHRVLIVPLRAGSGTRLKILEALASGLPVVSTTIGAEGLHLSPEPEIVIADDPDALAKEVAALLSADDGVIETMGHRGRALVEAHYDWDAIARDLRLAHNELVTGEVPKPTLEVISADPPSTAHGPEISVIIPTTPDQGLARPLLDGLAGQRVAGSIETVCVDVGSESSVLEEWRRSGIRIVSVHGVAINQGAALNVGASAAQGDILVFAQPDVIPADETWLAQLAAPFGHENAPAAVQGGITAQLFDGAPPYDPAFTRESVRWRADHGGIEFSATNAAMAREVWQQFPFPPVERLADRAWQRIAAIHGLLVLPCLAAAVRQVRDPSPGRLYRESLAEGRAWRLRGVRYGLSDLWADLVGAKPVVGPGGEPSPAEKRKRRVLRLIRPIGLSIGNRFSAP